MWQDDKHISTSDADGVALAAIKALSELVKEKDARIAALEKKAAELETLEANVAELKTLVHALLQASNQAPNDPETRPRLKDIHFILQ